jgi:hypothetical protein
MAHCSSAARAVVPAGMEGAERDGERKGRVAGGEEINRCQYCLTNYSLCLWTF